MNTLIIVSSNPERRAGLLALADWKALGFQPVQQYENMNQASGKVKTDNPVLLLWDTDKITEEDHELIKLYQTYSAILEIIVFSDMRDYDSMLRALDLHIAALISPDKASGGKFNAALRTVLNSIDNQFHQSGIMKRQLLRDIIKGKHPSVEDLYRYFNISDPYASYIAFYIKRDEPVRFLDDAASDANHYYAVNWHGTPFHEDLEYIATVNLYMHSWCTLIRVRRIPSTLNLYNLSRKTAAQLQQSFAAQMNGTVSIAFSDMFQGFRGFPKKVETLQEILDLQNYNGRSRIASYRDPLPLHTNPREFINVWSPRFAQSLYENNADAACANIRKLFDEMNQDRWSRSRCLQPVCRKLVDDIDSYCRNYSVPTVREMSPDIINARECYSLQDITEVFQQVLSAVFESIRDSSVTAIDNDKIHDIIKYVENNCETASVSAVAEHFHMSVDYLSHFFKGKTGMNLSTLITEKKVNRAKNLLLQQRYRIRDVAEMVGFNSSQYFSTVFSRVVGMSPREFIESHNTEQE